MNGDDIIETDAAEPTEDLTTSLDSIIGGGADSIQVDDKGEAKAITTEEAKGDADDFIGGGEGEGDGNGDESDEAARAAEAAKAAEEAKKKASEDGPEGRARLYLNHLPEERRELIRLLAENADMTEEEALAKIKGKAGGEGDGEAGALSYDELSAAEKITVDEARLKEVAAALLEKDELMVRDDEWKKLYQENQELVSKIASNKAIAAVDERSARDRKLTHEQSESAFLDSIESEFPDLKDEASDLWAAVAGRSQQINSLIQAGKQLPEGFDAGDINALRRKIVEEQHQRLTGKAPEAKPGAQDAKRTDDGGAKKRPVPGSAGRAAAQARPVIGQGEASPTVKLAEAKTIDEFSAGLDRIIKGGAADAAEPDDELFVGGRRFELVS